MPVKLGSAASAVRKVAWPCVLLLEPFRDSLENKKKILLRNEVRTFIAGLIPLSLQLPAQVRLASLGWRQMSGECARPCARRSVCFCNHKGGGASILLLT